MAGLDTPHESFPEFLDRLQLAKDDLKVQDDVIQQLRKVEQDPQKALEHLSNLVKHFDDKGKWTWIQDIGRQGVAIAQGLDSQSGEGLFLSWWGLACIMQKRGSREDGVALCRKGLELGIQANDLYSQGMAHHFIGIGLGNKLAQFVEATTHLHKAVICFEAIDDKEEVAAVYFSTAWVMRNFGDYDQAMHFVCRALDIASPGGNDRNDTFRGTCIAFKADLENLAGQIEKAEECYGQCVDLFKAKGDTYHLSASLANLGRAQVKLNKPQEAKPVLLEALQMARDGGRRINGIVDIMRSLAASSCLMSEREQMDKWYYDALELAKDEKAGLRPGAGMVEGLLRDMGLANERFGDLVSALDKLTEAEALFEKDWSEHVDDYLRYTFREIESIQQLGPALQRLLLVQNLPLEALAKAEAFRARALSTLLRERRGQKFNMPGGDELLHWLRACITPHKAAVLYFSLTSPEMPQTIFQSNAGSLWTWVLGSDGNLRECVSQDLASSLPDKLKNLDVFIRHARGCVEANQVDGADADQFSAICHERGPFGAWPQDREVLKTCYKLFIEPALKHIEDEQRLIIIPDGPLWMVPFGVLMASNGRCLIEDFSVQCVPSLSILAETHQMVLSQQPPMKCKALVVGHPQVDDSLAALIPEISAPLPEAEKEAMSVAESCQASGMLVEHLAGAEATKECAIRKLPEASSIVHFATHAILQKTGGSALALAGAEGFLNAEDIHGLRLPAKAVILSCCNTGRGKLNAEGVIGLPRAFIAAGVPSIVMTLWKVGDCATRHVMEAFYRAWLQEGKDMAEALRAAMLEVASMPGPQFRLEHWAAFTLVGCSYKAQDVFQGV